MAQGESEYVYLWNQRRLVGRMSQHQINTVRRRRLIDEVTQQVPLVRGLAPTLTPVRTAGNLGYSAQRQLLCSKDGLRASPPCDAFDCVGVWRVGGNDRRVLRRLSVVARAHHHHRLHPVGGRWRAALPGERQTTYPHEIAPLAVSPSRWIP